MKAKKTILIVDDQPVARAGLALWIHQQRDMEVCGEAQSTTDAIKMATSAPPDIAVVDLLLQDSRGLDLIRDLAHRHPNVPCLVFSTQDERLYAQRALWAGAKGYLMKQEAPAIVIEAIRQVLEGHIYVSQRMQSRFLDGMAKNKTGPVPSPLEQFTDRELQVYRLAGEGLRTRDIAAKLHLSVSTVETYCERIKLRLSLESRNDIVRHAALWLDGRDSH